MEIAISGCTGFVLGFMLGAFIMCLIQVNRDEINKD